MLSSSVKLFPLQVLASKLLSICSSKLWELRSRVSETSASTWIADGPTDMSPGFILSVWRNEHKETGDLGTWKKSLSSCG